jgi:hypothetical protein
MNLKPFRATLMAAITELPVYMYHFPETETYGVLLLHSMVGARRDPNLPGLKTAKFQAIVRAGRNNFESGYELANRIITAFKVVKRRTEGNMLIHFIEPMSDPIPFPVSKGGFIEFSCNFDTAYTEN